MDETVETGAGLSPAVVAVIALLSVGGLLFVGWLGSDDITGNAVIQSPYAACCTVQPWGSSISGYSAGSDFTSTELCDPFELPQRCCMRAGTSRFHSPVRLLDSRVGVCPAPELSYPADVSVSDSYSACCTTEAVKSAPSGFIQMGSSTNTERCSRYETARECCARAGSTRTKSAIRVLGSKFGSCVAPQTSYPAPLAGGYTACCTGSSWRNSPTGYTQGTAESMTSYCDSIESLSQCCARSITQNSQHPMKLLGFRIGSCEVPEKSYPVWLR